MTSDEGLVAPRWAIWQAWSEADDDVTVAQMRERAKQIAATADGPPEHDARCERIAWHDAGITPCTWRERACVENWSGCESGEYNPRCCRFPKSCSVRDVEIPAPITA